MTAWFHERDGSWRLLATAARLRDVEIAAEEVIRREHLPRHRVRLCLNDHPPKPSTCLRLPRPGQHFVGAGIHPAPRRPCRRGHR